MQYRAVLFDLDGTLLDTLRDIADSVNKVLGDLGFPQHELVSYKSFIGEGMEVLALRALPEDKRDTANVSELVVSINEEYSQRWVKNTCPYPGIPELLDALTRSSIRMTILSNKPHYLTERITSKILARWHFEVVLGAKPSLPKKPDPVAALQIARELDLHPAEFLYLGDSGIDMRSATGANMYPVGALWGFRPADELLANGARTLIERPNDLLRLL